MIEHFRTNDHAILAQTDLLRLGKLNIICGKNNSGKSTLLRYLAHAEGLAIGVSLAEAESQLLFQKSTSNTPWANEARASQSYRLILQHLIDSRPIWWSSDGGEFQSIAAQRIDGDPYLSARPRPDGRNLLMTFQEFFPKRPKTLLIPAKRTLETDAQVDTAQPVDPTGYGILNRLFYGKNQLASEAPHQLFSAVKSAFERISGSYSFDIRIGADNRVELRFATPTKSWLAAHQCGLGLQDLLVIIFFALESGHELVLIEEPENHLHPEMQRKLLNFLRHESEKQFFLATHSNVFLDVAYVDRIFYTYYTDSVHIDDATSRAAILNDLGYEVTDNLVSDLVILVEGPSDSAFLHAILGQMEFARERVIKIWPLGGDIMDQLDLSVFAERYTLIALLDQDPGSAPIRNRFERRCKEHSIPVHRLKRYSLENYFSLRALREIYKGQISSDLNALPVDQPIGKVLDVGVKRNTRRIGEVMRPDELAGTDLMEFLDRVKALSVHNQEIKQWPSTDIQTR